MYCTLCTVVHFTWEMCTLAVPFEVSTTGIQVYMYNPPYYKPYYHIIIKHSFIDSNFQQTNCLFVKFYVIVVMFVPYESRIPPKCLILYSEKQSRAEKAAKIHREAPFPLISTYTYTNISTYTKTIGSLALEKNWTAVVTTQMLKTAKLWLFTSTMWLPWCHCNVCVADFEVCVGICWESARFIVQRLCG